MISYKVKIMCILKITIEINLTCYQKRYLKNRHTFKKKKSSDKMGQNSWVFKILFNIDIFSKRPDTEM